MNIRAIFCFVLFSCSISNSFAFCRNEIYDTLPGSTSGKDLPEVVIKKRGVPLYVHGDTISYDAAQYNDVHTSKLQDLLKKVPGFRVDESGRIFFNSKEISKILIDGDDLSGNRYTALSRNLRASLVKQLQVLQRFQENRLMKGHVASDAIALNIKIHDEYTGRSTGNLFASNNIGSYGALNADLLKLHRKKKQLLFLDKNNIGNEGLFDDQHMHSEETFNPDKNNTSWPFSDQSLKQQPAISSRYKKINNDQSMMSLTSFNLGRYIKLRTETIVGRQGRFQYTDTRQRLSLPGIDPVEAYSLMSTTQKSNIGSMRLVFERDNKRKHLSRYTVGATVNMIKGAVDENRKLIDDMMRRFEQRHRTYRFSFQQQETWSFGRKGLLLIDNSFILDNHHQNLQVKDPEFVFSPFKNYYHGYVQQFYHKGFFLDTHLGRVHDLYGVSLRYGIRGSYQRIISALHSNDQIYDQQKTYVYFSAVKKLWSSLAQEFQFALGSADLIGTMGYTNKQFIYRIEHTLSWDLKPLNKIRVGFNADRAAPQMNMFHAGPLFLHNGIFAIPADRAAYPRSTEIFIDVTKIDLYKGLTAMLSIRTKKTYNEMGSSSFISPAYFATGYFIITDQRNVVVVSKLEQFVFPIKMKYSFSSSYVVMRMPQQINNAAINVLLSNLAVEHKIISNWKGPLNVELFYSSTRSRFSSLSRSTRGTTFRRYHYAIQTNLKVSKKVSGGVNYAAIQTGKSNYFVLLDARMKAKLNSRWTANIDLTNAFNNRTYREHTVGVYTNQVYALQLNGRRLLFGLSYSF